VGGALAYAPSACAPLVLGLGTGHRGEERWRYARHRADRLREGGLVVTKSGNARGSGNCASPRGQGAASVRFPGTTWA